MYKRLYTDIVDESPLLNCITGSLGCSFERGWKSSDISASAASILFVLSQLKNQMSVVFIFLTFHHSSCLMCLTERTE